MLHATRWNADCGYVPAHPSVNGRVEDLPGEQPALQLLPEQAALSLRSLHEAAVLLSAAGQVRYHLVDGAVWNVFVNRETRLTCFNERAEIC